MSMYDSKLAEVIQTSESARNQAMAANAYIKSGKFKRFLEPTAKLVEGKDNIHFYTGLSGSTVYIFVYVTDLEGFTGNEVEGLVNLYQYLDPSDMDVEDQAAYLIKKFSFDFNNVHTAEYGGKPYPVRVRILVEAKAKDDSETCKRVVVGYTEPAGPQPIYKLECNDSVGEVNV